MFSRPAPQLIRDIDGSLEELYQKELKKPIKPFKQGSGADIGFFPRSILMGLFMLGIPGLFLTSYGGIRVAMYSYRNFLVKH